MAVNILCTALVIPAIMCTAFLDPLAGRDSDIRVSGGVIARKGDFPYAVSLQLSHPSVHFCTGSLLDATTVLTAAHCIHGLWDYGFNASDVVIRAGSLSRSSGGILAKVSSMVPHPSFSDDTLANDVGIFKLQKPIAADDGVGFATLASEGSDPDAGTMATTAGWGDTYHGDHDGSRVLREVDIPIVSREKCAALYRDLKGEVFYPDVTETMVCAGYIDDFDNGKDSCKGDSGGPLIDTNTGLIVGVVSWGSPGCGSDGHVGVYARVGHLSSFIDKYMDQHYSN